MAKDEAYRKAEQQIEEARRLGATVLDLSSDWATSERRMPLTELPESLVQLTQLESLSVSFAKLAVVQESLGKLTRLKYLNLSGGQLTVVPEAIKHLRALESLALFNNRIEALPEWLGSLTQLRSLDLSDNHLIALPEWMEKFTHLEELDLTDNGLTALPESLLKLENLKVLFLHDNPGLEIPEDLLGAHWFEVLAEDGPRAKPPKEILSYYFGNRRRAATHGTQPLNEAKVIVLGEAGVGKSSLILALTEGKLKQPLEKTHGIMQKPWQVPLRAGQLASHGDKGEELLRLNLWDFGGQEVYHSTHTFFLTRRAVYLLVADARANDHQNNLEYWLQMATSFGAAPPVWVAVNKCDQHGGGPDEHALRRKFPNICGFLRTSCWTGDGVDDLKEKLVAEALSLEGVRQPMNKIWLGIKHALESCKKDTISLQDYQSLCREHQEKEEGMPEKLLDLWDKLGTVRYFPQRPDDPPEMRDTAILNPEWVTKAVYAVLDDKAVRESGGLATDEDFGRILKKGGYVAERSRMIEQVMRRFDLLYDTTEYEPQHKMLVPQLLPEPEPEHAWPAAGMLGFVYRYPVLPSGLVPGFIARRHRLLSRTPGPWRNGCVLDFPTGARTRVLGDKEQKLVTISVVCNDPIAARDALDAVRATFEEMHGAVEGLIVEELTPVPGHPDAPLLDYRLMRDLEFEGTFTTRVKGAKPGQTIEVDARMVLRGVRGTIKATEEPGKRTFTSEELKDLKEIMGDNITQNIGGGNFTGPVAAKMENCTNIINQQNNGERRDLLQAIQRDAKELIAKLPADKQEEAAENLELLIKGANEAKPNRKWYSVSAEGLLEASKFVKDFSGNITGTIGQLGKLIWPDFSMPKSEDKE